MSAYASTFERFEKESARAPGAWLAPLRRVAMGRFTEMGFPTTKQEAWRYTNLGQLARIPFRPAARSAALGAEEVERLSLGDGEAPRVVFVNGHYAGGLSRFESLPAGVKLASLAAALISDGDLVEQHLARYADHESHALAALNTAFIEDGVFLYVPDGVVLDHPVHLVFVSTRAEGPAEPTVSHPRVLVVTGEASQATIVESYIGSMQDVYFTNAVTEITAGDGSVIDHYKVQRESREAFHVATMQASLGRNSTFSSHSVSLGGLLVRNDINAVLGDEGADCTLNGLYVLEGRQHVDNHLLVDHARPHGTSRQLYKGVLDGASHGVFDGLVVVRKDAQKTDSRQEIRNLILSEEALVDTKPTLQILANDVKCSHGATTGQLDEQSMFYLRSRAIGLESAREILVRAFMADIIGRIKVRPLRDGLDALLHARPSTPSGGPGEVRR